MVCQAFDFKGIGGLEEALEVLGLNIDFSSIDVSNESLDVGVVGITENDDGVLTWVFLRE